MERLLRAVLLAAITVGLLLLVVLLALAWSGSHRWQFDWRRPAADAGTTITGGAHVSYYYIMGQLDDGEAERIDETDNKEDAVEWLLNYALAFGDGWRLWVKECEEEEADA